MVNELDRFVAANRERGIILDSNIFLLYAIGNFDVSLVERFKRTKQFVRDDFDLLVRLLTFFGNILILPNILTEVSNLAKQLGEPIRTDFFRTAATSWSALDEHYITSADACADLAFPRLGLADSAISLLARHKCGVLTDDAALATELMTHGVDTINFNHLRIHLLR